MCESSPNRGRVNARWSAVIPGIALFFVSTTVVCAQDVADAARQEQTRKAAQKSTPKHVYTDDDLKQEKILTPEDEVRVAERKRQEEKAAAKVSEPPQQGNVETTQEESLGEVARRFRKEKAAREAEEASKRSYTLFRYEMPRPATAAPKPNVGPLAGVGPEKTRSSFSNAIQPVAPSKKPQSNPRMSPFQPRPMMVPRMSVAAPPVGMPPSSTRTAVPSAGAVSPAPVRDSNRGVRSVKVLAGDSWWKLANAYLGSGSRWTELRAMNSGAPGSPELLRLGTWVSVPDGKKISPVAPGESKGATQIKVKTGDTLWALARHHLGRGSAWTCLANANPQVRDYQRLTVGTVIDLPVAKNDVTCAAPVLGLRK